MQTQGNAGSQSPFLNFSPPRSIFRSLPAVIQQVGMICHSRFRCASPYPWRLLQGLHVGREHFQKLRQGRRGLAALPEHQEFPARCLVAHRHEGDARMMKATAAMTGSDAMRRLWKLREAPSPS